MRRIFVRAPNWVGDLVMATPSFDRLRQGFPDAEISCGLRPYLRGLLSGARWFDELIDMPKAGSPVGLWHQARTLRRHRFDLAVILPNSIETGLCAFLAGIPQRLGYRQGRPFLINIGLSAQRARRPFRRHGPRRVPEPMPTYYRKLLDVLGLSPPRHDRGVLVVTDEERASIDSWLSRRGLADGRRLVLLTAGASYGGSKLWMPDRFAAVARHFLARGDTAPVFLAGPAEVSVIDDIARRSGAVAATDPVLPLGLLKALVERASVMVTTDTGPRHIAVALGVPVVCLMGPNDRRYTDYGLDKSTVIRRDLPCSPCQRKVCPLGHHDCMKLIGVDEVIEAVERWLIAGTGEAT